MKFLKIALSPSQIRALLRKDILVRWRQPLMTALQFFWPCMAFMLLYLIRLKYGPEDIEDCQFPTRLLPTKNNVLPGFYSYICSIENKCSKVKPYEEYMKLENAPMKPIIDIVQLFINDDNMFNSVIELPEKHNFISAVTTLVTSGHIDEIRGSVEKVIDLVPQVEKFLNGSFDIKRLFSNRETFVKGGYLLCGHPFPSSESIPLVNDILYSEDFSEANDDELNAMPTNYCKRLYLDVTSTNHGKLTWNVLKPIIHGKILYGPDNDDTRSIMKFSNTTFEELDRLKMLSVAMEQILTKLRVDEKFQSDFNSLIKLAQAPFVRSLIGDQFNIDQIEGVIERIRNDPIIYDVITTIKNILECFSVDRFVPTNSSAELRKSAYDLNLQRLFYAAVYFDRTEDENITYHLHMDTENTQPTVENHNRFWFPGPSRSMVRDMKYHRGFIQIKEAIDIGIIKHKKEESLKAGVITEKPTTTTRRPISVEIFTEDTDDDDDDDDDEWFTNGAKDASSADTQNATSRKAESDLLHSIVSGVDLKGQFGGNNTSIPTKVEVELPTVKNQDEDDENEEATTLTSAAVRSPDASDLLLHEFATETSDAVPLTVNRRKRQGFFDLFLGGGDESSRYEVDNLKIYTKQFPYPAYTHDDFKTGLYLAQAIQVAFFLGLVVQIAISVRHRIWMRESLNSMIMRSMGLKPCSEMVSWVLVFFVELAIVFVVVTIIMYVGGILAYTTWLFVMLFLVVFGACLISFCYMCSTFFTSATIGAVATAILFFISFCPYIIVLMFDATLNSLQNFAINLSFTTAFAHCWAHIMRMEVQQFGLTFEQVCNEGVRGEFGFGIFMIVLDMFLYIIVGNVCQRFKRDEYRFVQVERQDLDASVGATMTNVSKIYDDNKIAVGNISLSFARNQVTCLLGRNGAGKSTIIKMLTGQVVPTSGRVVLSQAMSNSDHLDKVGVCSQDNILIPNLTAREHLQLYAKIKLKHGYDAEVDKTLKSLNFGKHESYEAHQLSGGYQRRLCVAIAFIGSPNVVILDEPCNGVDNKARKDIWDLIERLRKGRAVIFSTHFLDEAEYLSDLIVFMKNGKIIAKHNPETMKSFCTEKYKLSLQCSNTKTEEDIKRTASKLFASYQELDKETSTDLRYEIPYDRDSENSAEFVEYLLDLQGRQALTDVSIESQNLEQIFKSLDENRSQPLGMDLMMKTVQLKKEYGMDEVRSEPLTRIEAARHLFGKRLVHFSRNYRMLLCVIVLPAIFELLAMWFVAYRLDDDYDKTISFSRDALYPHSTQMLSMEIEKNFTNSIYDSLQSECDDMHCKVFADSEKGFYWILDTLHDYHYQRFGGYTFNDTKAMVWFNNKGYHAVMAWLNDLNTHILRAEMNDSSYTITSYNEPWKLEHSELTTSSVLRQSGDSCMAFILLIAFSLVIAAGSVYLVNERVKGEKLQQRLCGVDAITYWSVAFAWDFMIIVMAILVCTSIILAFGMPVFVARQQLWGIVVLALFFGFATIPAVHVLEKLFMDSSMAIVSIFCINLLIPLATLAMIVLLGVVGDTPTWDHWRHFLNRAFLIFPQHALGDGLLEICKNYMVAQVFHRYDIDSYKNPVHSDLLLPHLCSLAVLGVFFIVANILLESGILNRWWERARNRCERTHHKAEKKHVDELKIVSIQNSLKRNDAYNRNAALRVDNLSKSYGSGQYAVQNVTFAVNAGECLGLLGKNGAGKSTIFKILSGQLERTTGSVEYQNREISYCPQTNTLDSLLTVTECIRFYGHLRRITNIDALVASVLEFFQLEPYRDVLVKNLSGGNRRKLTVATACCGRTAVVLMDEPTSDMDPVTRAIVYRTIHDLLADQRAIVLTSHSISEIDDICDRIVVLKDGQMLTCSSPESLKAQYGGFYNVVIYSDQATLAESIRQVIPQCVDLQVHSHSIKFNVKVDANANSSKVRESGIDVPAHLSDAAAPPPHTITLADLFRKLNALSQLAGQAVPYSLNRCRLDAVFERILDSSDHEPLHGNGLLLAGNGSPSTGYIHNGYVETETIT